MTPAPSDRALDGPVPARPLLVCETPRLRLRRISMADAPFLLALLNEPSWLRYIGDKGIRTIEETKTYIAGSYLEMYERCGHGLYLVELKPDATPIGICGLIKREGLADADLGYAFRPAFWGQGYALEAATAAMVYGKTHLGLKRLVALTALDNHRSTHLLEKLGFQFERSGQILREGPASKLYGRPL